MAIDNAYNGGLFAARIVGTGSKKVSTDLNSYQKGLKTKVKKMNADLKKLLND